MNPAEAASCIRVLRQMLKEHSSKLLDVFVGEGSDPASLHPGSMLLPPMVAGGGTHSPDGAGEMKAVVDVYATKGLAIPITRSAFEALSVSMGEQVSTSILSTPVLTTKVHAEDPMLLTSFLTHGSAKLFELLLSCRDRQILTPSASDLARRAEFKCRGIDRTMKVFEDLCGVKTDEDSPMLRSRGVVEAMEYLNECQVSNIAIRFHICNEEDGYSHKVERLGSLANALARTRRTVHQEIVERQTASTKAIKEYHEAVTAFYRVTLVVFFH